jgi:acyl dehydratase
MSLRPGDTLPPLVVEAVSREPMKTMAALLDDPSPIHYDAELVRELGLGQEPINQGCMNLGYLVEMLCRGAGGPAALRRIRVRYLGSIYAGERVECTATVTAVDTASGDVDLALGATADGRPVLTGAATIAG